MKLFSTKDLQQYNNIHRISYRGTKVKDIILDVGKYFPFVNREKCLLKLLRRLNKFLSWCKYRGMKDSSKMPGSEFIVCSGASGIGKTAFVMDGLYLLESMIDSLDPEFRKCNGRTLSLLESCTKRGLVFRLSFVDITPLSQELQKPELCLAFRVLYQYLDLYKLNMRYIGFITQYSQWMPKLSLKDVVEFIRLQGGQDEQLVVIHIDETQKLKGYQCTYQMPPSNGKRLGFLYQLIECLWNSINEPNLKSYVFPILSGINSLDLYDQFHNSNLNYYPIALPLFEPHHFEEILKTILPKEVTIGENLKKFLDLALAGHITLFKAFISVASWSVKKSPSYCGQDSIQMAFWRS
jgi:hypothetical protein